MSNQADYEEIFCRETCRQWKDGFNNRQRASPFVRMCFV